jgi:hypothetical protein
VLHLQIRQSCFLQNFEGIQSPRHAVILRWLQNRFDDRVAKVSQSPESSPRKPTQATRATGRASEGSRRRLDAGARVVDAGKAKDLLERRTGFVFKRSALVVRRPEVDGYH